MGLNAFKFKNWCFRWALSKACRLALDQHMLDFSLKAGTKSVYSQKFMLGDGTVK